MMKNESIDEKQKMQEQKLKEPKQYTTGENRKELFQSSEKENMISCNLENKEIINQTCKVGTYISPKQENINSNSQTFGSFMSFVPSGTNFPFKLEEQIPKLPEKKRRVRRGWMRFELSYSFFYKKYQRNFCCKSYFVYSLNIKTYRTIIILFGKYYESN